MNTVKKGLSFVPPNIESFSGVPLGGQEFNYFKDLIYNIAGISINEQKVTLVQSRLGKRLRELGISNYSEYIKYIENDASGEEITQFTNALTTNKTEFFRENAHFEYLKEYWVKNYTHKTCYIWSAACSTGAEVYTLGIQGEEFILDHRGFDYRIVGSDIDSDVLKKAHNAIYSKSDFIGLPPLYMSKYFERGTGKNNGKYRVKECITSKVKFKQVNLIDDSDSVNLKFDVIFLRNVLIYFSRETIEKVIIKMHKHLKQDGLLFIGHSESLHGLNHKFKSIGTAIYQAK